jgi:hypothetical protein
MVLVTGGPERPSPLIVAPLVFQCERSQGDSDGPPGPNGSRMLIANCEGFGVPFPILLSMGVPVQWGRPDVYERQPLPFAQVPVVVQASLLMGSREAPMAVFMLGCGHVQVVLLQLSQQRPSSLTG